MAKKHAKASSKEVEEGKMFAFLGTFLGIIGFVIVLLAKKDNKYAMFYAKQGLVITIAYVIAMIVMIVPILGWIVGMIAYIVLLVLWVISWIYALSGEEKYVPIIGKFADKFDI